MLRAQKTVNVKIPRIDIIIPWGLGVLSALCIVVLFAPIHACPHPQRDPLENAWLAAAAKELYTSVVLY